MSGHFSATTNFETLSACDTFSICVPTPLSKTKDPDISHMLSAARRVARELHEDQLVILESATYPGTTDEVLLPMLEESGLRVGQDFFLAFAPERVDPGNVSFTTRNTPKIVGGVTPECTRLAACLYALAVDTIVPVCHEFPRGRNDQVAREHFRLVNVALVNELALMSDVLGVDIWEAIDAAATKPYGFMPFKPGPGLGGHCIPVDPRYLAWKVRSLDYRARFIELATDVNEEMPRFVADQVSLALNEDGKSVKGSSVLVVGVAYKANIPDTRESPAFDVIDLLVQRQARVSYLDGFVD